MSEMLEKELVNYFQAFDADHNRRREQLVRSLPAAKQLPAAHLKVTWSERLAVHRPPVWLKPAMAAAAVFVILFSVMFFNPSGVNSQAAWADSVQKIANVTSIHLKAQTNGSEVEIWWRRPNESRMLFSNGLVITNNNDGRRICDQKAKTLTIVSPETAQMDMAVLGMFGQLFTSENVLSSSWMKDTTLVKTENISYKGEACQKLTFEGSGHRCEYILEPALHLIYQVSMYNLDDPSKMVYRMEVLDVDRPMATELFTIQPQEGVRVNDRRNVNVPAMPSLPEMK